MRNLMLLTLFSLCGCAGLRQHPAAPTASARHIAAQPGDTFASVAEEHYGAPDYGALIAYYNDLPVESLAAGTKVELPAVNELVSAMPALKPHGSAVDEMLRARAGFAALLPHLLKVRAGVARGVDKPVPENLKNELTVTADQFDQAGEMLQKLRASADLYPERLHTAIEIAVEEIRTHASGRYHRRRLSVRQTEHQVARIFAELLRWHKVLSGDLSPDVLVYPRSCCG